jgi:hypothetical protein
MQNILCELPTVERSLMVMKCLQTTMKAGLSVVMWRDNLADKGPGFASGQNSMRGV